MLVTYEGLPSISNLKVSLCFFPYKLKVKESTQLNIQKNSWNFEESIGLGFSTQFSDNKDRNTWFFAEATFPSVYTLGNVAETTDAELTLFFQENVNKYLYPRGNQ